MNEDFEGGWPLDMPVGALKGAWPLDMPIEVYFLKYSFPCAFITLQRGRISQAEFDELEKAAINGEVIDRGRLELVFVPAFRRMRVLASERGLSVWDRELMQEYYWLRHNELIEAGVEAYEHAPEVLKELCKVRPATVEKVCGAGVDGRLVNENQFSKGSAVVKFDNGKTRAVMTDLVGSVGVSERVMVHYGYAVEKL